MRLEALEVDSSISLLLTLLIAVWAVYLFSWDPVIIPGKDLSVVEKAGRLERMPSLAFALLSRPIPAGQVFRGLGSLYFHETRGHPSYLFGEYCEKGWWYFFPVVLAVKTPIAFLILAAIGCFQLFRGAWRGAVPIDALAPFFFASVIFLFYMRSFINAGVRHTLMVYPLLSIAAAYGVVEWFSRGRPYRYITVCLGSGC